MKVNSKRKAATGAAFLRIFSTYRIRVILWLWISPPAIKRQL